MMAEPTMPFEEEEKTTTNWMKEAQKGYIRVAALIIINKQPAHGYEIMKEIKDKTRGFWKPTAGGVYPILRDLEKAEYIEGEWSTIRNRKIKIYKITQKGEDILKRAIVKQSELATSMNSLFKEFARDVLNMQEPLPMPEFPNPFSAFLEEEKEKKENSIKDLELKRKHIESAIKMMQTRLREINKKLESKE